MSYWLAALLGLIQGICEFLPISSSGHLTLFETLFHLNDLGNLLFFNLCCHLGTLAALLIILRKDWIELFYDWKKMAFICMALLPLIPIYFLFKNPINHFFSSPNLLGLFFIISGALLLIAQRQIPSEQINVSPKHAFFIGVFQSIALIPGISRLGSTLFAARYMGWDTGRAVRFSFLLAIPTIVGGVLLEIKKALNHPVNLPEISMSCYLIAFCISFMVGLIVLRWFLRYLEKGSLKPFSFYLLLLGSLLICLQMVL